LQIPDVYCKLSSNGYLHCILPGYTGQKKPTQRGCNFYNS
jgi:hypothetical protein